MEEAKVRVWINGLESPSVLTPASQTCERRVVRLGRGFLSGGAVTSEVGARSNGTGVVAPRRAWAREMRARDGAAVALRG